MNDRTTNLTNHPATKNILYVMRRDQRIHHNHSITLCYTLSSKTKSKLFVLLDYDSLTMNERQKRFVSEGIEELKKECKKYNLCFCVGEPKNFIEKNGFGCVVVEFSPLKQDLKYNDDLRIVCENKKIGLICCDSHNIVPCKLLEKYKKSSKAVKADLYKQWNKFVVDFEELKPHEFNEIEENGKKIKKEDLEENELQKGGFKNGMKAAELFIKTKIKDYTKNRNKCEVDGLSKLSPWLHTGQISAQKVVLMSFDKNCEGSLIFIDEIFAWRETAEHFCYHEKNYDNIKGALEWAQITLKKHETDKRDYLYELESFENAKTHDPLWNAAQNEMLKTGKMHGYARMYWAKQILRWTKTPEKAIEIAIYLNDKYSLDGNDPNGYLGVMWSICGTMDQGWGEKNVFGKIRSMNAFKAPEYINRWS